MNMDTKFLNTVSENRTQQYIIRVIFHDQMGFILGILGGSVFKINNVIYQNRLKKKIMTILSDTEKAFDKIQYPFVI